MDSSSEPTATANAPSSAEFDFSQSPKVSIKLSYGTVTTQAGDLLLALYPKESETISRMLLVEAIYEASSDVKVQPLDFSVNGEEGTWTISGKDCYYTKYDFEEIPSDTEPIDSLSVPSNAILHTNPSGTTALRLFFNNECPFCCNSREFCPGCGGVSSVFPDLFMSCGVEMACPVCLGYDFAEDDMRTLKELEYDVDASEGREIWKERCEMVNERRRKFGFQETDFGLYFSESEGEEDEEEKEDVEEEKEEVSRKSYVEEMKSDDCGDEADCVGEEDEHA